MWVLKKGLVSSRFMLIDRQVSAYKKKNPTVVRSRSGGVSVKELKLA